MQGTWSPAAGPGLDNGNWKKMAKNCKMVIGSLQQSAGATWSLTIGPSAVEKKRDRTACSAQICRILKCNRSEKEKAADTGKVLGKNAAEWAQKPF